MSNLLFRRLISTPPRFRAPGPARAYTSAAHPPPQRSRYLSTFLNASALISFGLSAYVIGAVYPLPLLTYISPRIAPPPPDPDHPDSKLYLQKLEEELHSLPLLADHRSTEDAHEWYETRPYLSLPEERRANSLTAGALRGPGKLALPPLVRARRDETEGMILIHVGRGLCGHDGIIHGGMLATLLDESLARTAILNLPDKIGVTANLNINYRAPTRADQFIVLRIRLLEKKGRKTKVAGTVEDLSGNVLVEASATFVQPRFAQFLSNSSVREAMGEAPAVQQPMRSPGEMLPQRSSPKPILSLPKSPSTAYTTVSHPIPAPESSKHTKKVIALGEQYILPVYARPPIVLHHGEGSWVWDCDGRKFLDFTAGIAVNALGHADEGVTEVLRAQSSKILHASNVYHNEHAPALAALLVTLTQREGGLGYPSGALHPATSPGAKVFFANSGTEANEGALKVARKVGKDRGGASKIEIVCFEQSFHGRSLGALSITSNSKYQDPFRPLLPGVRVGKLNVREGLEELIGEQTCAVVLEPIQGEGGVNAADVDWVREVVKRAREVGAVVIFDEIQCGLYRTGNLWAHGVWPVECHPDIVTMAKPLANGYPIGAVLLRDAVAETMTAGTHGTTFGGSPLACAVGHHVLSRLSERAFESHLMETSAYLVGRLGQLSAWFPEVVGSVRGRGLILGLALKRAGDPERLVQLARERGVLLLTAGKDCVRLVPSLSVRQEEAGFAADVIEGCLAVMGKP
ncbi:acetylornithine and succinylornithine aminotransferase [Artomyces pyxidatus]|uniref:Acetylornithine and succinylornithine aminotransferase n=1 Tax=Artomyces pyxidatus TaxID=48021 RepID=A0ACB8TKU8_9AGAM|nr:acetylornithine and succinylornithine aminotransferase [Artomyces pyxidatus]